MLTFGSSIGASAAPPNNAKVIAPERFKLELEPLSPKVLKNRDAHIDYIKNTQENADILRELVKHTRALRSLDSDLDIAWKSKKHTHKPKAEDSIQEKLYLLHMDLCGPMRIQCINERKYILVIVIDYSREDLGKLKPKEDIGIFVGYAPAKKAYRIYNKRTRLIIETIHVDFDELTAMASEQFNLGPGPQLLTPYIQN
ncbi:retrovirus-related pol polyprotein from transposon TNT 1-94 [Tanacetum coccineum]